MPSNDYSLPPHYEGDGVRLNLQGEAFRLILDDKLLRTPIPDDFSGRVLDIGTGTGIWAWEFATEYPSSTVVGADLYEPGISPIPENLSFQVVDLEKTWDLPPNSFDIVHARMFLFLLKNPQAILQKCFEALKPGGFVEFQEMNHPCRDEDESQPPSSIVRNSLARVTGAANCGFDWRLSSYLPEEVKKVNFEDVQFADYKFPIGPYLEDERMKKVGEKYMECYRLGVIDFSKTSLMKGLGWTEEQVLEGAREVRADLGKVKAYSSIRVTSGKKPIAAAA
ncbi:S-adenosyl-L-methionine-dependent methyltransferase [Bombardia bombarda]|uniref:S-adenosyl-L-methionine-dependent methyltransferase n=1 Tax=Bombardia bombarda TaxID=252184 RepID=A0AA39WZN5_9PEZI|nr:S-adenosyl-L-methionine-dependent methyltransferase [Bombardia bombarda]